MSLAPRLYEKGKGWGNAIEWSNWDKRRVTGWKTPMPREGDYLEWEMQGGKMAIFCFAEMQYCGDPSDMFFATMADCNYKDEFDLAGVELHGNRPEHVFPVALKEAK